MIRRSLTAHADSLVPAARTGLLTTDGMAVLATPLITTLTAAEAVGVVAGTVGAATAVGGLATAATALVAKGDEEEPSAPPTGAIGNGGHVSALLARRSGALG